MKFFGNLIKLIAEIFLVKWLLNTFKPPGFFSWQTLFWLSIFSYFMSVLANSSGLGRHFLANMGWLFLILMVAWWASTAKDLKIGGPNGIHLAPWITGALLSVYIFEILGSNRGQITPETIIFWPIISALLVAIALFVGEGFKLAAPPPDKRQFLVILLGTQVLLSCWLQFYFVVQNWLEQYPSMLADDLSESAFLVKLESPQSARPRGAAILNLMGSELEKQFRDMPWSQVERVLLPEERNKLINEVRQKAQQIIAPVEEDKYWEITDKVSSQGSGYNLELRAIWQGPRLKPQQEYSLAKSCQMTQVFPQTGDANSSVTNVECGPVRGWGIGNPVVINIPKIPDIP